jgi:hypothetical protein
MYSLSKPGAPAGLASPVVGGAARLAVLHRRSVQALALSMAYFFMPNQALALEHHAQAAIKTVANFDATTWAPLLAKGPRPAAYVFTNTFCATCPQAFAVLSKTIQASGKPVALVAVVMDVPADKALAYTRHYTGATQLYAFDGYEPEIRQTVDPTWRNITPYIVMVERHGAVQRVTGLPDATQLKAWLQ